MPFFRKYLQECLLYAPRCRSRDVGILPRYIFDDIIQTFYNGNTHLITTCGAGYHCKYYCVNNSQSPKWCDYCYDIGINWCNLPKFITLAYAMHFCLGNYTHVLIFWMCAGLIWRFMCHKNPKASLLNSRRKGMGIWFSGCWILANIILN